MSKLVLIIDDEPDLADTCARVLRAAGYECVIAEDSAPGLALFDSRRPALVLSDINLPTADGFEVARYVQRREPGVPVILMTAHHHSQVAALAESAGAARYLRKPFSNAELAAAVKTLISAG